ncbi:hypothetical protein SJS43_07830 [Aeromonas caviae]|uniref:hypothetical protein n=1 Tax=Aeromonas caviae TaxID=648 RepID=UPI0029D72B7A|nr:hypothetical protein [Aeromonas caviae]MDX7818989.1 hypothetical protein [Aeromonas caviae]
MPNSNPQGFDRSELADFYEKLVLYFELNDCLKSVPLSARSKGYRKLKQDLNLVVYSAKTLDEMGSLMHSEAVKISQQLGKNIICVYNSEGSLLKSIFTQLRNAAAHAHIRRIKQGEIWYQIEHVYASRTKKGEVANKRLRFFCQMKKTDFWRFVAAAKNLKSTAKSETNEQSAQPSLKDEVAE